MHLQDLQECQKELQVQPLSRSSREIFCARPPLLLVAARRQAAGWHVWENLFSFDLHYDISDGNDCDGGDIDDSNDECNGDNNDEEATCCKIRCLPPSCSRCLHDLDLLQLIMIDHDDDDLDVDVDDNDDLDVDEHVMVSPKSTPPSLV